MLKRYASVIEFVVICCSTSPDSSWRSTTTEIYDTVKSSNFHVDLPPLLIMPAQRTFHEHRGRLGILKIGIWCPFHGVFVNHFRPVSILVFRGSTPRNLASTSTKHRDAHKTTNLCSNPVKLSINEPSRIICTWE